MTLYCSLDLIFFSWQHDFDSHPFGKLMDIFLSLSSFYSIQNFTNPEGCRKVKVQPTFATFIKSIWQQFGMKLYYFHGNKISTDTFLTREYANVMNAV